MSVPSWADLEAVFHEALALGPAERATFLAERCAGRLELQAEVEALIRTHESTASALERPPMMPPQTRLKAGMRLGSYEVLSELGAGGMGEVYRARDTTLGREVALKILPQGFTADPERLARFRREAQMLASLNHPNIAAIYGFEDSGGARALVLELVEGPTLAARIAQGPIPLDEALPIARQIAEALEAAHEQGIIHRDLKPSNIKLRPDGTAKVLDFGLAKVIGRSPTTIDASHSPTITSPAMTGMGVIMGTAAYMSPEQATGRQADKRSDVWAFGAVLYEMLSGRRAFKGDDMSDTLAAVLRRDIDWTALPESTPATVRRLMARCLDRDVRQRLRDIGEARIVLADPAIADAGGVAALAPPQPLWRRAIPVLSAAVVTGALSVTGALYFRPSTTPLTITRFPFTLPEGQQVTVGFAFPVVAISPDGTQMVYAANKGLFLRSMSELEARPIPGTESLSGAFNPVFSPDGQSIAFVSFVERNLGTLKRIAVSGGAAVTICPIDVPFGISWDRDGIVFGQGNKGIMRVSPDGGKPELLVSVKGSEVAHGPQMLLDGQTVLFTLATGTAGAARWDSAQVVVQSLRSGERKTLIEGGSDARYLPTGHLVYALSGVLFAVPFDLTRLEVTGGPAPIVEGVRRSGGVNIGSAHFSFSETGSLIYVPGPASTTGAQSDLALIDRQGVVEPLKLPSGPYQFPRISPDGKRLAFATDDGKDASVWIYDLSGTSSIRRLTFGGKNRFPIWSADGERVAFQSDREGDAGIFWQRADGTGTAERLTTPDQGTSHVPDSWSPKGDRFLFDVIKGSDFSLWTVSLQDTKATPFGAVQSSTPITAVFSPDGRWVAYGSTETGLDGIYVQPFPSTGAKYQASQGGIYPGWSPDGKELFYFPGPGQFGVVSVTTQPSFTFGNFVLIPRPFINIGAAFARNYDITPDGQRIIGVVAAGQTQSGAPAAPQIQVVLNWFEELKRLVPKK